MSTEFSAAKHMDFLLKSHLLFGNNGRIQWEALVTGFAAVIVAWITVSQIRRQIRQTDELAQVNLDRRHRAARAVLPMALAEIYDYGTACIRDLYAFKQVFKAAGVVDASMVSPATVRALPLLPESILPVLRDCIETGSIEFAEACSELIRFYQVQRVRLKGALLRLDIGDKERPVFWAEIEGAMIDAAEVVALSICLFPFARGETEEVFLPNERLIRSALWEAGVLKSDAEVTILVERWKASLPGRDLHRKMGLESLGLQPRKSHQNR